MRAPKSWRQRPTMQFVLTSDGPSAGPAMRWKAGRADDALASAPAHHFRRIVFPARPPREAVQTRLDLWLKTHIENCWGRVRFGQPRTSRASAAVSRFN